MRHRSARSAVGSATLIAARFGFYRIAQRNRGPGGILYGQWIAIAACRRELQPGLGFVNLASTAFSALARETG
jgi:hypothetical protein